MTKPLGTGVWFTHKGNRYDVGLVESGRAYGLIDCIGLCGKNVNICADKIYVKTEDNVVLLSDNEKNGIPDSPLEEFRNGMYLG